MRGPTVLLVAVSLVVGLGTPVNAGPPIEESFDFTNFHCELSGAAGSGFVFVSLQDGFAFADAAIWLEGSDPEFDEPDLVSEFEGATATVAGDQVSAQIPMLFTDSGEPDGTLTLEGVIGQLTFEETFADRFREGNRWVEINETIQVFEATAAVQLDEVSFEAACSAERGHVETRLTNPHALRVDFDDAFIECLGLAGSDGSSLNLFAGEFMGEAFLNLEIFPAGDGEVPEFFGFTEIGSLSGTIHATVPLFDPFDGEEPISEAQVVMTIEEGEVTDSNIVFQHGRVKETVAELLVSGSVEVALDGRSYALDGCFGSRLEAQGIFNEASGPQETGRTPSNDTPEGALPLSIGSSRNQQTKAAALEPEEPCTVEFAPGELFDLPIGKTVWYTVQGTGQPITVDTGGSNFDTILGVYVSNDGLEQVACVDDVFEDGFSLQAKVTWDTDLGVTYLIQAGGFGLSPEFESLPEYGLLKISTTD